MAWYWIVLIVAAALFALTFTIFIFNLDMKLVWVVRKWFNKRFDEKEQPHKF